MRRHPAGKGIPSRPTHVVRTGETLWGIARKVLKTDDPRRIARYWPMLHRENRAVIGSNPNLILPGQVLVLPNESNR